MHPKSPKLLEDTLRACQRIEDYTRDITQEDYENRRLIRDAVERNLTIIGEALARLERVDAATAHRISDFRRILGLRHRLAHGYDDDIDDVIIWITLTTAIPVLHREVVAILDEVS